ncbi:hypothetical protein CAEBREN_28880 [Caenorhabditis brenneri]|uniref:Uncharacterized protein n=1 Tax=Caenorhabditis brenneri TaxID=135651 RepID=G0NEL9_CAEBE|nr:hypothetical protein CAEBREN_28880 [Caenorhabditis brenneri]
MVVLILVILQQMRKSLRKQLRTVTNHIQLLLSFIIMILLLLSFNFLNPVFKKMQFNYISESIHNLAIWTPVLTVTCHILQIIAMMTVLPNYRQIYWQEYCQKPISLC